MNDIGQASPILGDEYRTLASLLAGAARTFPDQEAFVTPGERFTYGQWHDGAMRLGGALVRAGLRPGDVAIVWLDTSTDYAVAIAAIAAAGGIATGVNVRLGRREVGAIVERAQPAVILAEDNAAVPPCGAVVIRRSELAGLMRGEPLAAPVPRGPSDIAVIIWTSGTTGQPKGAAMDHDNLRAATTTSGPMAAPYARKLNSTPFPHAGFMGKLWEQIAFGITLVLGTTPWSASSMLDLLVNERITIGGAVPTQWAKLLELPGIQSVRLPHLTVGITATAPAPPELIERVVATFGIPLIVRYSMTECPSMTGTRVGDSPEVLFRTVGRPQEGIEIQLVDSAMEPVPQGQIGRIRVRAAQVMRGYWRDPEQTAEVLSPDGWLLSSDLGYLREDGNLVLAGRTSEMYIRGGYNVYPIEVERVLADHPGVRAVAVIGRTAPVIGEIGVAFVEAADPAAPPTLAELRDWVKRELADYKAPDDLVIIEALPLNAVLKVDKLALRERLPA